MFNKHLYTSVPISSTKIWNVDSICFIHNINKNGNIRNILFSPPHTMKEPSLMYDTFGIHGTFKF